MVKGTDKRKPEMLTKSRARNLTKEIVAVFFKKMCYNNRGEWSSRSSRKNFQPG